MKHLLLSLLLLCGAAQACEPDTVLDGWCDNSIHDHVFTGGGELLDSIAKGKWWCGEELFNRCVGRVDTLWGGYEDSCGMWIYTPVFDTTWVLCCDSAASGFVDAVDVVSDSLPIHAWAVTVSDTNGTFSLTDRIFHPERCYIKSVDTSGPNICSHLSSECLDAGHKHSKCEVYSHCLEVNTTWAKKIPLSDVWLTPDQLVNLKYLIGATPPDIIRSQTGNK